jgi:hypothetical protein
MGFHKRNITKEIILSNINNIDSLLSADAFVLDDWSSKFIHDLDIKERELRKKIKEENKLSSVSCPDKNPNYKDLKSLSETLIGLMTDPDWLDIHFTQDKIGRFDVPFESLGVLEDLKKIATDRIIKYYDDNDNICA